MEHSLNPTHRDLFQKIDKLDGLDGKITRDGLTKALQKEGFKLDASDLSAYAKQHQLDPKEAKVLKLVAEEDDVAVYAKANEVVTAKAVRQEKDPVKALTLLDRLRPEEAIAIIKDLTFKQRYKLAMAQIESGKLGYDAVKSELFARQHHSVITKALKEPSDAHRELLVHHLDAIEPQERRRTMEIMFARPRWSHRHDDNGGWGTQATPDRPFSKTNNFYTQMALLHDIARHSENPETKARALFHGGMLISAAKIQGGDTEDDPVGLNVHRRDRPYYLALADSRLDSEFASDKEKEYVRRRSQLRDYYTVPKELQSDYRPGDVGQDKFPSEKGAKFATGEIQHNMAEIIASAPVGLVNLMKENPDQFNDESLTWALGKILSPPNKDALEQLYAAMASAANGLTVPPQYDEMTPEARETNVDRHRRQSAYALGALFGAAAAAADKAPPVANKSLKLIASKVAGLIPYIKKVPAGLRDQGLNAAIDAIFGGATKEVPKEDFQKMMDDVQRDIRSLDGRDGYLLETAYNNGRSIYRKGK